MLYLCLQNSFSFLYVCTSEGYLSTIAGLGVCQGYVFVAFILLVVPIRMKPSLNMALSVEAVWGYVASLGVIRGIQAGMIQCRSSKFNNRNYKGEQCTFTVSEEGFSDEEKWQTDSRRSSFCVVTPGLSRRAWKFARHASYQLSNQKEYAKATS